MKILTHHRNAWLLTCCALFLAACGSFKELNEDVSADKKRTTASETPPAATPAVVPEPAVVPVKTTVPKLEVDNSGQFIHRPDSSLVIYGVEREKKVERNSNYDISHTSLDLAFDFEKATVTGVATHSLVFPDPRPLSIGFDATDMTINHVSVDTGAGPIAAKYKYDQSDLLITLPRDAVGLEARVAIDFVAHPMRNGKKRGMYFVDGAGTDPSKPTEIWTLGQPEDNQFWFPSWDFPNDRMTFDIRLTVPQHMETVSNGVLSSSMSTGEGLRIDHWTMDSAHLGYLAAFAVGDFAEVQDQMVRSDGSVVDLAYFVDPEYADRAMDIFGETPKMMAFLENKLNDRYPWPNYKQVAVHDFTAGGMENTTATILYDAVQHDSRAALDFSPRNLIMHELTHQWFGDDVSAADWANLGLNEGLASYMEEVYLQAVYGEEEKIIHALDERSEYFAEARIFQRPVVWYGYSDPNEMYDDHTYEKASQALGQLRFEIGDEAFFRGLQQFIVEYGGDSATIRDLERVFSQVSSRSLTTFFDQWFYSPGHPVLNVASGYRGDLGIYQFRIKQEQVGWGIRPFAFPVDVEIAFENRQPYRERIYVTTADTTIAIGIAGKVLYGNFNRFNNLFAEVYETKSRREWVNQAQNDDDMSGRFRALKALSSFDADETIRVVAIDRLLNDEHYYVREEAARTLSAYMNDASGYAALTRSAVMDPSSKVRRASIDVLVSAPQPKLEVTLLDALSDSSYYVVASAIRGLALSFPERAFPHIQKMSSMRTWSNVVEDSIVDAAITIKSAEALSLLTNYLAPDRDESLRRTAAVAIGEIGVSNSALNDQAKNILKNLKGDIHQSVRTAAATALDEL